MDKTEKTSGIEESIATISRPLPDDFIAYVPWACNQLELEYAVFVIKSYRNEYMDAGVSDRSKSRTRSKAKAVRSRVDGVSDKTEDNKTVTTQQVSFTEDAINIIAIYDYNDDLVEISFNKNKRIPRIVLKIIGLIIKFYPFLSNVVIDEGADLYTVHELAKILPISNITDVCFDGTFLLEANYEILLNHRLLRHLSLSRCKIEDEIVEKIADKLIHSSQSLSILNLSSNRITDVGAKSLADVLRSNRCLTYLNLSDNRITDDGGIEIMNSLKEFCLKPEEILLSKTRYITFLRKKNDMITEKVKQLKEGDPDKTPTKKRPGRSISTGVRRKPNKLDREGSLHSVHETIASNITSSDSNLLEKAVMMVQTSLGDFSDPFSSSNVIVKDEASYCLGNNTLCCLNLAFNDLSYIFINKLISVLAYQKRAERKPRGLIYICIDGNNLPVMCDEYKLIETLLDSGTQRSLPINKKKQQSKVASR